MHPSVSLGAQREMNVQQPPSRPPPQRQSRDYHDWRRVKTRRTTVSGPGRRPTATICSSSGSERASVLPSTTSSAREELPKLPNLTRRRSYETPLATTSTSTKLPSATLISATSCQTRVTTSPKGNMLVWSKSTDHGLHQELLGKEPTDIMCASRILPLPAPVRQRLVRLFCPADQMTAVMDDPANISCL